LFHISLSVPCFEETQKGDHREEHGRRVDSVGVSEFLEISLPENITDFAEGGFSFYALDAGSADAGVGDEDVDEAVFFGDVVYDMLEVVFACYISFNWDDLSIFLRRISVYSGHWDIVHTAVFAAFSRASSLRPTM